jgi:long-chain fatty acid transport protein
MMSKLIQFAAIGSIAALTLVFAETTALGQGGWISAAGPINRSMGGASVAAPIDSIGAIYWNPASIAGMKSSEVGFGVDVLWSQQNVRSTLGPFDGSTDAVNGTFPVPNIGWVYKTEVPELTLGLGVNAVAGFKTNLPADPNNLALAPAPVGLGQVYSQAQFLQLAPVIAYSLSDKLSVAVGPTIVTGELQLDPFVFASPNADGNYPAGRSSTYEWGGGVQCGIFYVANDAWRFGGSFKSTNWLPDFVYNSEDANGLPRTLSADFDLPMVVSLGTSYSGWDQWLLALDLRYFDYGNTAGFGDPAMFRPDGSLHGLDWSSVFAMALGAQRKLGEVLTLRGGYTYNQNPIKNSEAFYNIASPLLYEHMLSTGFSLQANSKLSFNTAYSYVFENSRTGPLVSPLLGPIPGSTMVNSLNAHFLSFGIAVSY